jgi:NDP-sugar pyrophosphorylase family protein
VKLGLDQITAIVLAGGLGTRIRHLLEGVPKPMAPVAGKPFVEWVVRFLRAQGVRQVVISTGYLGHTIEEHFARTKVPGATVLCVREETPLGTAGGFLNAVQRSRIDSPAWLVVNGDSLVLASLAPMADALSEKTELSVLGVSVPDASRYGTLALSAAGDLIGFAEKRPGPAVINAGVYLIRSSLLGKFSAQRPLSFENDVFPSLLRNGTGARAIPVQAAFIDIGVESSFREAGQFIVKNRAAFGPFESSPALASAGAKQV